MRGTVKFTQVRAAAVLFIFVTVALDMVALGVIAPVLPKLIIEFEGGDVAGAASVAGVFGFSWAFMQFLFQPILGAVSDRFGRRPVVLLSNFGLGIDYLIMALAPNLYWLFLGRLISGITAASFTTASAYIADVTPPEERAGKFGILGAAFGLGFIIGPGIGGAAGAFDLRAPFWLAAALSLVNGCYGYFILPESLAPQQRARRLPWASANILGSALFLRRIGLAALALAMFLSYLAHESLPAIFVLYTDYRYHWGSAQVGLALAAVGIGSALVSGVLSGRVAHSAFRACRGSNGVRGLRPRTVGNFVRLRNSPRGILGSFQSRRACPHDATCIVHRARPPPGRLGEPSRNRRNDRAFAVHAGIVSGDSVGVLQWRKLHGRVHSAYSEPLLSVALASVEKSGH
ncbi:MAG: MFS transporter [Methylocella sp.]